MNSMILGLTIVVSGSLAFQGASAAESARKDPHDRNMEILRKTHQGIPVVLKLDKTLPSSAQCVLEQEAEFSKAIQSDPEMLRLLQAAKIDLVDIKACNELAPNSAVRSFKELTIPGCPGRFVDTPPSTFDSPQMGAIFVDSKHQLFITPAVENKLFGKGQRCHIISAKGLVNRLRPEDGLLKRMIQYFSAGNTVTKQLDPPKNPSDGSVAERNSMERASGSISGGENAKQAPEADRAN